VYFRIQINQRTRCKSFTSLLLDVYVWLNMFRAPPRPSSGAYYCTRSLWFYRWSVAVGALSVVVWQVMGERRLVVQCMLLMMCGEEPETCWATHKRQVINLWNCCIFLVDLFESYDDARTCERQTSILWSDDGPYKPKYVAFIDYIIKFRCVWQ